MQDLDQIVKAADPGSDGSQASEVELAEKAGRALVEVLEIATEVGGPGGVVVGHDLRPSGPELADAFATGVTSMGVDVIRIGLSSSDGLAFASGTLGLPGVQVTADRSLVEPTGMTVYRRGAIPVTGASGLDRIKRKAIGNDLPQPSGAAGRVSDRDVLRDYAIFVRDLVDISCIRHLKVVVDAGNGIAGITAPAVLGHGAGLPSPPITMVPMYFPPDGAVPGLRSGPTDPDHLVDLQQRVRQTGADLGLAFGPAADRCFVIDEAGDVVDPSALAALIAVRELEREPGGTVIHDLLTSAAVPQIVREHGGHPVRTRVGRSYVEQAMAQTRAVVGIEHSGQFLFRDFWGAASGMIAALHTLAALGHAPVETPLSSLVAPYRRHVASGEIGATVSDQEAALAAVRAAYAAMAGVACAQEDGLTVNGPDWWFHVRPSATEPLLRLNAEARTVETMQSLCDDVLAIIEGGR